MDGYNSKGLTAQLALRIVNTRGSSWHTVQLPVEDRDDSYLKKTSTE